MTRPYDPYEPLPRFEPGSPPDEVPTPEERDEAFGRRVDAAYDRYVDRLMDRQDKEAGDQRPTGSV
jgi:hypothetical protein